MTRLFARIDGVNCRSCGAHEAAPNRRENSRSLCHACNNRYTSYLRQSDRSHTENDLNGWIARQLFLSARRLQKFGVTGRCECITLGVNTVYMATAGPSAGYQCARPATMMRDGRRVCASHGQIAAEVLFVDGAGMADVYREFARLIAEISLVDERFFEAAKEAVENVSALKAIKATSEHSSEDRA